MFVMLIYEIIKSILLVKLKIVCLLRLIETIVLQLMFLVETLEKCLFL